MAVDPGIRAAAYHLISIWQRYDKSMAHQCESRGEHATDWLQAYGFAVDQGWCCQLTAEGEELLRQGDQMNIDPLLELPELLEERRQLQRDDYVQRGITDLDVSDIT